MECLLSCGLRLRQKSPQALTPELRFVFFGEAVARNVPDTCLPIGPTLARKSRRAGTRRVFLSFIPSRSENSGGRGEAALKLLQQSAAKGESVPSNFT